MKMPAGMMTISLALYFGTAGLAHAEAREEKYESFRTSATELRAINLAAKECDRHFRHKIVYNILVSKIDDEFSVVCSDPAKTNTIIIDTLDGPSEWRRTPDAPVFVIDLKAMKIVERYYSRD